MRTKLAYDITYYNNICFDCEVSRYESFAVSFSVLKFRMIFLNVMKQKWVSMYSVISSVFHCMFLRFENSNNKEGYPVYQTVIQLYYVFNFKSR